LGAAAFGAATKTWEMNGYQDFLRGRLSGVSITAEGRLVLAPALDTLHTSDQPEIWSIARAPNGTLYLGTGDQGRVYSVDTQGRATLVWTANEPEIFAVAVDARGIVYAGTSPNGKVYRIENGREAEYFDPGSAYIWGLLVAPNGDLYVATGDQGKIFRVTGQGRGELYYETGQAHVTALALDTQGRLLAGTEPNGILYRITGTQRAFVLYDSTLPELRSIAPAPDGSIYAAALGGGVSRLATAAYTAATSAASQTLPRVQTSVTVTPQQGGQAGPPKPAAPAPASQPQMQPAAAASTVMATTAVDYLAERSALYRIHPDNTVETLWSSNEENIYDIALDGSSVMFLTDAQGRVYRLTDRKVALVTQTNEGDATRLLATPSGTLAATGHVGRVLRIGGSTAQSGWFESPVHDAGTVARWGRLSWQGQGRGLLFRTRSGNTSRPDATWSSWSDPITNPDRATIQSPNARYIQWRAELSRNGASPELANVTIAYLPQNTAPVLRSVTVNSAAPATATAAAGSASASPDFSVTVSASGQMTTPAGTPSQTFARPAGQKMQITWQADDAEGDRLLYAVYFRGDGESQWKLLRAGLTENSHTIDGDALADGRYQFRVTASDRLANPLEQAREAELASAPVWIDNTPPVVAAEGIRRNGARVESNIEAEDRGSALRRCEYSVDAGPWTPVEAEDGVTDSPRERFELRLDGVAPGEHLVTVRVFDAAGNAGLAKIVVR
jgi:hypothetical protein